MKQEQDGSLLSMIFTLSVKKQTPLLAGIKLRFYPPDPEFEGYLSRKYLKKRPVANETLAALIGQLQNHDDIFVGEQKITPDYISQLVIDPSIKKLIVSQNIQSALASVFRTTKGSYVINLLGTSLPDGIPEEIKSEFRSLTQEWKKSY